MVKLQQGINLENYTLIMPSLGMGNVGQLAVDLLITNLNLQKVGQFNPLFVPIFGTNACERSHVLLTMIDIYAGSEKCIVAIQIHPPSFSKFTEFFDELKKFITQRNITKIIILSSSDDYENRDIQPQHLKLRYVASPSIYSESGEFFKELNWIPHELQVVSDTMQGRMLQDNIPGDRFAMIMFECIYIANIPCAILYKFCSKGDNITDAIALLYYLNQWIHLLETTSENIFKDLKFPPSWIDLFGRRPWRNILLNQL